ncbi:MAG TPA: sodium:proton antiporter [Bacteroidales bacterium]|nr:MAG: sodium:proton antiporter [Bacteroidetes bacterium GWF2_33_38]HBF87231.1 sodium:proton antiporter [Bacteroidales bacterium]
MLKNIIIAVILIVFAVLFFDLFMLYEARTGLTGIAQYYAQNGAKEVGAANLVTSIVVTYRGFDTLGEVTILFVAASIISFFLKLKENDESKNISSKDTTEILVTASNVLVPVIFLFGIYVFINGHLTPGGGFQGGAIIATGVALMILANPNIKINTQIIHWVESISGVGYVVVGIFGLILAGGFLDNKITGLGEFGALFSAGAIPIIYSFIGLKVGAEISNILNKYQKSQKND